MEVEVVREAAHEDELDRRDLGAALLEAAEHLADEAALHALRLDEQQRALQLRLLQRLARVHVAALGRRAREAHCTLVCTAQERLGTQLRAPPLPLPLREPRRATLYAQRVRIPVNGMECNTMQTLAAQRAPYAYARALRAMHVAQPRVQKDADGGGGGTRTRKRSEAKAEWSGEERREEDRDTI